MDRKTKRKNLLFAFSLTLRKLDGNGSLLCNDNFTKKKNCWFLQFRKRAQSLTCLVIIRQKTFHNLFFIAPNLTEITAAGFWMIPNIYIVFIFSEWQNDLRATILILQNERKIKNKKCIWTTQTFADTDFETEPLIITNNKYI